MTTFGFAVGDLIQGTGVLLLLGLGVVAVVAGAEALVELWLRGRQALAAAEVAEAAKAEAGAAGEKATPGKLVGLLSARTSRLCCVVLGALAAVWPVRLNALATLAPVGEGTIWCAETAVACALSGLVAGLLGWLLLRRVLRWDPALPPATRVDCSKPTPWWDPDYHGAGHRGHAVPPADAGGTQDGKEAPGRDAAAREADADAR